MDRDTIILLAVAAAFVVVIIAVFIIQKITAYSDGIRCAKMEMERACDDRTYRHWKRELKALRMSSYIPFMTPHRAKAILRKKKRRK